MKKLTFLLLIPILFLAGCSFSFDTSIPDDNPPIINMENWAANQEKKEDKEILEQVQDEDAAISDEAMLNVVIPSQERETQRLLEEYQATLDAINESIE